MVIVLAGGHLDFFPEAPCIMKVSGYYCIVLDLLVLYTYIKPPKQRSMTFRKTL